MQNIMISVRPEWCAKIANGEKTDEIRKTIPQCEVPFKCYIYCTKGNFALLRDEEAADSKYKYDIWKTADFHQNVGKKAVLNSKVIGEFICDSISEYESEFTSYDLESDTQESICKICYDDYTEDTFGTMLCTNECEPADNSYLKTVLYNQSLVPYTTLKKYVGLGFKKFYGWHISDLVVNDEPKELSAFSVEDVTAIKGCQFRERVHSNPLYTNGAMLLGSYICTKNAELDWCSKCLVKTLQRAPQSWCYVKGETNGFVSV